MTQKNKIVIAVVTFAASLFLAVLARISVIRTGYTINELETQHKEKLLELSQREHDLTQARSLSQLQPKAKILNLEVAGEYPLNKIRYLEGR